MTRLEFDAFCGSLPATSHVEQWGGASVWKIGGKIFTLSIDGDDYTRISFKCSDLTFMVLTQMPGIIPAPYLARAKWVQVVSAQGMSDQSMMEHIGVAYEIVVSKLTKAQRSTLGIVTSSKGI